MKLEELINDKKTTIIDVRTIEEFDCEHMEGSINIPLHDLPDRLDELKEIQPLVLCCLSGGRSGQAKAYLESKGFTQVYDGGGWEMVADKKK